MPERSCAATADALALRSADETRGKPVLARMVTDAIRQRQSDAYSLLKAIAQIAGTPAPTMAQDVETNGSQKIVAGDSLARLALRY